MNKLILSLAMAFWAAATQAQVVNIPDANFLKALIRLGVDQNNDSTIQVSEAKSTTSLDLVNSFIDDLTGIEEFTELTFLNCSQNSLDSVYLAKNTKLIHLDCFDNQLTSLDIRTNTSLAYLKCADNPIKSLDVSNNIALTQLECFTNQLTALDVSKNTELIYLECYVNEIKVLDVSNNIHLEYLQCYNNELSTIDISNNVDLVYFDCSSNDLYPTIDISMASSLKDFYCEHNSNLEAVCIAPGQQTASEFWNKDSQTLWNTSCGTIAGLNDELLTPSARKLVRIITPLGQAIKPEQATEGLYIYQYSDGSTEKVMKQ